MDEDISELTTDMAKAKVSAIAIEDSVLFNFTPPKINYCVI